eukprot:scaffold23360_cov15-Tisochrysis_lutea.AAC.1
MKAYDEGGSKGEDREEAGLDAGGGGPPRPKIGTTRPGGEEKEETFYDAGEAKCCVGYGIVWRSNVARDWHQTRGG